MVPTYEQEQKFILRLGEALIKWQSVEGAAYSLFQAFMTGADQKLVSVIFHHIQSFHSAIGLLDRCAYFAIPAGPLKARWEGKKDKKKNTGLCTRLKDQTAVRNRLVHFYYKSGSDSKNQIIELGPSHFDATYAIKDRWRSPENKIGLRGLRQAGRDFDALAKDIREFRDNYLAAIAE